MLDRRDEFEAASGHCALKHPQALRQLVHTLDAGFWDAMEVAVFLEGHPAVSKVNYLGLSSHPDHNTAIKQMRHPGAMLSFEMKGGLQAGKNFIDKLRMCIRAVSLGTCDTLLCHPASMTHYGIPKEKREEYGITDGLIRMSVGIENVQDIIADLIQALD